MLDKIRQVISRLFKKRDIKDATGIEVAASEEMSRAIALWTAMYEDKAPWVDNDKVKSMNLPATIANEIARLVTLEMKSEVVGNEFLNEQYQRVIEDIREVTEYAAAKGGLIFKPYVDEDRIAVDYVQADLFFPTKYDSSGNITGCIFVDRKKKGSVIYSRLEHHELVEGGYRITNRAYKNTVGDDSLGNRIPLTAVEEWKDLSPEAFIPDVEKPLYGYFKIPIANNIDTRSPLGCSVYSRAVNLIKEADKQYSRILWEYEGSELAIDASIDVFKLDSSGKPVLPEGKERLFRAYDFDADKDGRKPIEVFSPGIRDESLFNGLNRLLQRIEFACGLAYGTLSDMQMVAKTATEIKASKQRTYSTVSDIQKSLEHALTDLVDAMNVWARLYGLGSSEDYEVSFEWDDSLAMDMDTEYNLMLREVSAGILKPEYYLKRRYGVTDEQLKEMMPEPFDDGVGDDE